MSAKTLFVEGKSSLANRRAKPLLKDATHLLFGSVVFEREYRKSADGEAFVARGGTIIPHVTIDGEIDRRLYPVAANISDIWLEASKYCARAIKEKPHFLVNEGTHAAVRMALVDRVVSQMRKLVNLSLHAEGEISLVWPTESGAKCAVQFLETAGRSVTDAIGLRKSQFVTRDRPYVKLPTTYRPLPSYPALECNDDVVIITNLNDKQYRSATLELTTELHQRGISSVVLAGVIDGILGEDVPLPPSARVLFKNRSEEDIEFSLRDITLMNAISSRAYRNMLQSDEAWVRGAAGTITNYMQSHLLPLCWYAESLQDNFHLAMPAIRYAMAMPGRYVDSRLATQAAAEHEVPNLDIQAGIIGATERFFAPAAEHALCMDPASHEIYRNHLKWTGPLEMVGSLRLDWELRPYRRMKKKDARSALGYGRAKTLLLATQPVGPELSQSLFLKVLRAIDHADGWKLVIKLHPNEDDTAERRYQTLADDLGIPARITREGASLEHVVAADAVATYFSTVGLEAFCLGKPVFRVKAASDVPFDLVGVGAAVEATAPLELASMLTAGAVATADPDHPLRTASAAVRTVDYAEKLAQKGYEIDLATAAE